MIDASRASSTAPFDPLQSAVAPAPDDGQSSPRRSRGATAIVAAVSVLAVLVIVGLVVTFFADAVFGAGAAGGCGGG